MMKMGNKWKHKRKQNVPAQIWWQCEGKDEGESERRQETLTFGGVNH